MIRAAGLVLRTYTGRKTLPPSTSLPVMVETAGVNTASLGGYLHSTKTKGQMGGRVPRTQRQRVRHGEGWAPPGCTLPKTHYAMKTYNHTIPDRSPPRSTRTAPSAVHQDGGVNCATGASSKIRGRDNITIGTLNTRTLRPAGKLQELTHEMDRYRWNILGLCEMRWKTLEKQQQRKDTRFSSVGKRINMSMVLDFLFTRTS